MEQIVILIITGKKLGKDLYLTIISPKIGMT